jgi:hypothetical protein
MCGKRGHAAAWHVVARRCALLPRHPGPCIRANLKMPAKSNFKFARGMYVHASDGEGSGLSRRSMLPQPSGSSNPCSTVARRPSGWPATHGPCSLRICNAETRVWDSVATRARGLLSRAFTFLSSCVVLVQCMRVWSLPALPLLSEPVGRSTDPTRSAPGAPREARIAPGKAARPHPRTGRHPSRRVFLGSRRLKSKEESGQQKQPHHTSRRATSRRPTATSAQSAATARRRCRELLHRA